MSKAPIKGSYIDTQGMSGPSDPNAKPSGKQEYKPAIVTPRRLFTPTYAKEMKILINEVLDEREGRMNYTSYFETTEYKHPVTEEEPAYTGSSPSFKEIMLEALREWVSETEYLTQPTDPEGRYFCSKSNCEGVRFNE
tara:strand:+ start:3515 stop:3928 length:414 start_codon:yes stop_codon:yes gene_type:complete